MTFPHHITHLYRTPDAASAIFRLPIASFFSYLWGYSQRNMPSVFIKTYGCQMNERDSEAVAAQLVAKGYSLAPTEAVADVVLLTPAASAIWPSARRSTKWPP